MAKDYRQLWEGVTSASDEGKAVRSLAEILVDKEGRIFISNLEREDAKLCIETLDRVSRNPHLLPSRSLRWLFQGIVEHNLKTSEKQAFLITLRRLAGIHGRLPDSMMITEEIKVSDKVLSSGGFADIRSGTYMGHLVAVKTLRVTDAYGLPKIRKVIADSILSAAWDAVLTIFLQQFCKEVVLWNTLSHPNVLKLVGVLGDMGEGEFITVSEWMVHGNIMEYIRNNHANRLELVRGFTGLSTSFIKMRRQLHGAAQGLQYLHSVNLVHGDLKGVSVSSSRYRPLFLRFYREISSCRTTPLLAPASRILASRP
jgi:hypothetical protein